MSAPPIPEPIYVTPYTLGLRFLGVKEIAGMQSNPLILAWLKLDNAWPADDAVPWCSAFCSWMCWQLGVDIRSKSLAARSWAKVGTGIDLDDCEPGWDVVVVNRGGPSDVNEAGPGHVGFYHAHDAEFVTLLSGNISNGVNVSRHHRSDILAVRRLV